MCMSLHCNVLRFYSMGLEKVWYYFLVFLSCQINILLKVFTIESVDVQERYNSHFSFVFYFTGWASRTYFSDNGSTAVEIALKMAFRKYMFDHCINADFHKISSQEGCVDLKVDFSVLCPFSLFISFLLILLMMNAYS